MMSRSLAVASIFTFAISLPARGQAPLPAAAPSGAVEPLDTPAVRAAYQKFHEAILAQFPADVKAECEKTSFAAPDTFQLSVACKDAGGPIDCSPECNNYFEKNGIACEEAEDTVKTRAIENLISAVENNDTSAYTQADDDIITAHYEFYKLRYGVDDVENHLGDDHTPAEHVAYFMGDSPTDQAFYTYLENHLADLTSEEVMEYAAKCLDGAASEPLPAGAPSGPPKPADTPAVRAAYQKFHEAILAQFPADVKAECEKTSFTAPDTFELSGACIEAGDLTECSPACNDYVTKNGIACEEAEDAVKTRAIQNLITAVEDNDTSVFTQADDDIIVAFFDFYKLAFGVADTAAHMSGDHTPAEHVAFFAGDTASGEVDDVDQAFYERLQDMLADMKKEDLAGYVAKCLQDATPAGSKVSSSAQSLVPLAGVLGAAIMYAM